MSRDSPNFLRQIPLRAKLHWSAKTSILVQIFVRWAGKGGHHPHSSLSATVGDDHDVSGSALKGQRQRFSFVSSVCDPATGALPRGLSSCLEGSDVSMLEDQFEPAWLVQFAESLAPYDPVDLLAAAGGLQLLPENAHRAIRLEVLAHVAASLSDDEANRPLAGLPQLDQWCNTGILGQGWGAYHEDPFDNPFLEAFPFYDGNFLVFPGIADESTFVLHLLCQALFVDPDAFSDPLYVKEARELLSAVLALSNEVARRAGLVRGVEIPPWEEGQVGFIPDEGTLAA